jgi:hypothetical protein
VNEFTKDSRLSLLSKSQLEMVNLGPGSYKIQDTLKSGAKKEDRRHSFTHAGSNSIKYGHYFFRTLDTNKSPLGLQDRFAQ